MIDEDPGKRCDPIAVDPDIVDGNGDALPGAEDRDAPPMAFRHRRRCHF
jgi:hypothetical protein